MRPGPEARKAFAALEEIDKMVAVLEKAIRIGRPECRSMRACRTTAWREWSMNSI